MKATRTETRTETRAPTRNGVVCQGDGGLLLVLCAAVSVVGCEQGAALGLPEALASLEMPTEASRALPAETGASPSVDWQRALGEPGLSVTSNATATDASGNAFFVGRTNGALVEPAQGMIDAFVAAYSAEGAPLWTRQIGTPEVDAAVGVTTDYGGDVIVAGSTGGALGGEQLGFGDAFVTKLSAGGATLWTTQLGSDAPDAATGISAAPGGELFLVGQTRGALAGERPGTDADAFMARFSAEGALLDTRQLGSAPGHDDIALGVSAIEGAVFIVGRTFGALEGEARGSADAFAARYSTGGELLWVRQFGTPDFDAAEAVAADAEGNVYVAGQSGGFLAGGPGVVIGSHPFVVKYGPDGELLWEQQLGAATMGAATGVASDARGSVFIAGYTSASFGGPNLGVFDAFLAQLSEAGELLWVTQPGVGDTDRASGVSADGEGNVFLSQHATSAPDERFDYSVLTRFR